VVQEAQDRQSHTIRSLHDYVKLRRLTGCMSSALCMSELAFDLPDEVFYHPVVVELYHLIIDIINLENVRYLL
jgi:hypothetical protein